MDIEVSRHRFKPKTESNSFSLDSDAGFFRLSEAAESEYHVHCDFNLLSKSTFQESLRVKFSTMLYAAPLVRFLAGLEQIELGNAEQAVMNEDCGFELSLRQAHSGLSIYIVNIMYENISDISSSPTIDLDSTLNLRVGVVDNIEEIVRMLSSYLKDTREYKEYKG